MEKMKRYEELGMAEALSRSYDYPSACQELALILRCAYAQLPKTLHALLFRDTLAAFRLLPVMQTSHGLSAANLLLQAAEAVLPKQKKALAVAEFKRAVVAHKRHYRAHQHGVLPSSSYDVDRSNVFVTPCLIYKIQSSCLKTFLSTSSNFWTCVL